MPDASNKNCGKGPSNIQAKRNIHKQQRNHFPEMNEDRLYEDLGYDEIKMCVKFW